MSDVDITKILEAAIEEYACSKYTEDVLETVTAMGANMPLMVTCTHALQRWPQLRFRLDPQRNHLLIEVSSRCTNTPSEIRDLFAPFGIANNGSFGVRWMIDLSSQGARR